MPCQCCALVFYVLDEMDAFQSQCFNGNAGDDECMNLTMVLNNVSHV